MMRKLDPPNRKPISNTRCGLFATTRPKMNTRSKTPVCDGQS
jgi:hypothetical protein